MLTRLPTDARGSAIPAIFLLDTTLVCLLSCLEIPLLLFSVTMLFFKASACMGKLYSSPPPEAALTVAPGRAPIGAFETYRSEGPWLGSGVHRS